MHDVYMGKQKIGRARNWKSAELMATVLKGGKWKAVFRWKRFGRATKPTYLVRPLSPAQKGEA